MTIRINGPIIIGTAAEFAASNPVLLADEVSLETDTGIFKRGDGATAYASVTRMASASPSGDATYPVGKGPVVTDTSDGHTYRIKTTAGTLGVTQIS